MEIRSRVFVISRCKVRKRAKDGIPSARLRHEHSSRGGRKFAREASYLGLRNDASWEAGKRYTEGEKKDYLAKAEWPHNEKDNPHCRLKKRAMRIAVLAISTNE